MTTSQMRSYVSQPRTWEKFLRDGTAKRHSGSSFVSYVVTDSPFYRTGVQIMDDIRAEGFGSHFALLPPSSLHMTVLQGIKERRYVDLPWPGWLDGISDLPQAVLAMCDRLVQAQITGIREVSMKPAGLKDLSSGDALGFLLEPATDKDLDILQTFRHRAGEVLEIEVPSLDEYHFHSTLGYRLIEPDITEVARLTELQDKYTQWTRQVERVDLEEVAFCIFNDMLSFSPLVYAS